MADTMHLSVISYEGELFSEDVSFVKVFSKEGELGIYPEHTTLVCAIEDTDVVYEFKGDHLHSFYVSDELESPVDVSKLKQSKRLGIEDKNLSKLYRTNT